MDANTGSLGQGVSIAGGMALAAKYKGESHRVFVITGDGESQEGLVWDCLLYTSRTSGSGSALDGTQKQCYNAVN